MRRSAAEALDKIDEIDDSALAAGLARALSHVDEFVRRKAAQVVGYYTADVRMLDELARLADADGSEQVRSAARESRAKYERKLAYFR